MSFDNIIFLFRACLIVWIISYLLRPFLPDKYNEVVLEIGHRFLLLLISIPTVVRNTWVCSSSIMYYLGMFSILGLFLIGLFMFLYTLLLQFGIQYSEFEPIYKVLVIVAENKAAWAGATIVIATTVAVGHMWNLRINSAKFDEEMKKFKREEQEAFENKRNKTLSKKEFNSIYPD